MLAPSSAFVTPSVVRSHPSLLNGRRPSLLKPLHHRKNIFPFVLAMSLSSSTRKGLSRSERQGPSMESKFEIPYNRAMSAWPGELNATWDGCVKGVIPEELIGGTFWVNGPGTPHEDRFLHPLDGHGYLRALRILQDGKIRLQAKMIQTPLFKNEEKAGKLVSSGLATLPHTNWLRNLFAPMGRNACNTCVLPWAGKIVALYEGGLPHAVDPETLETLGTENFGGALAPSDHFLAHTRWDSHTRNLFGVTPKYSGSGTDFTFREIGGDGHQVTSTKAHVNSFAWAHDLAVTKNHFVILQSSVALSVAGVFKAMMRMEGLIKAIEFVQRPSRLLLFPRNGEPMREVDLDRPMMALHHANAYEEDGSVVLITCAFPGFAFGKEFGWQGPWRPLNPAPEGWPVQVMRIEVDQDGQSTTRVISDTPLDFPKVRPDFEGSKTRHIWGMLTRDKTRNSAFCGLAHIDLEAAAAGAGAGAGVDSWIAPPGCLVGEPLVVPKLDLIGEPSSREEDVWVVALVYDGTASRTTLAVFDGDSVRAGPVCEIRLPLLLPYGFHGFWQPAAAPAPKPAAAAATATVLRRGRVAGRGGTMLLDPVVTVKARSAAVGAMAAAAAAVTASALAVIATGAF